MKKIAILCLSCLISPLFSQEAPKAAEAKEAPDLSAAMNKTAAVKKMMPSENSFMMIDAAMRASDYKDAFETLKKDKTANKIAFHLTNGESITNIADITLSKNGSLLIVKFQTVQGNRYQVIPVENIASLSYQP